MQVQVATGDSREYAEKLRGFYAPLITQHQNEPFKAVSWGSANGQDTRFRIIKRACNEAGAGTLLDVGCGLGDFSTHWRCANYMGIDMVPEMIDTARVRHSNMPEFVLADLLSPSELGMREFDAVVASGIFGIKAYPDYARKMIAAMWARTGNILVFNMLSSSVPEVDRSGFEAFFDADGIMYLCQKLTPFVKIDHSYRLNDFTVCMYREQQEV